MLGNRFLSHNEKTRHFSQLCPKSHTLPLVSLLCHQFLRARQNLYIRGSLSLDHITRTCKSSTPPPHFLSFGSIFCFHVCRTSARGIRALPSWGQLSPKAERLAGGKASTPSLPASSQRRCCQVTKDLLFHAVEVGRAAAGPHT